jgi:hypothetical protein
MKFATSKRTKRYTKSIARLRMNTPNETYVVDDDLIVSYHDLDVRVSQAKQAYDTNRAILEVRDVHVVPVRNESRNERARR